MNIAVFLDAVMPINGPAVSHSEESDAGHDKLTTSYPLWTLDNEAVTRPAAQAARIATSRRSSRLVTMHFTSMRAFTGLPRNRIPYFRAAEG